MRRGVAFAAAAYTIWGVLPLYFALLHDVAPLEILAHRVVWSLVFLVSVLTITRRWAWARAALANRRVWLTFGASASILAVNWFIFIWAIGQNRVVETSLGYFINPLINVLVGALVLRERLQRLQGVAVALAAVGVGWLTWHQGQLPWIALSLAATFATYGLLRKTAPLGAIEGLTVESLVLAPLAVAYLAWTTSHGQTAFAQGSTSLQWLLLAAGPATAIPLLLFGAAAQRIPFSLLGMLQYIGPTLALTMGVLVLGEPFGTVRAIGFCIIWLACLVFSAELLLRHRASSR